MPLVGLVFFIGLCWAVARAVEHVNAERRSDRDSRVAEAAKKFGSDMPEARRRRIAARADAAWTAREILHGFPVTRTGFHQGWQAHKTAAVHQRAQRLAARELHDDVRQSFGDTLGQYRARRAAAQPQRPATPLTAVPPAAQQQDAEVLPLARKPAEAKPAEAKPAVRADAQPGPFAKPPTLEAVPASPTTRPAVIPTAAAIPVPASRGVPAVTSTATEYTYDQTLRTADNVKHAAESHLAAVNSLGIPQMTDSLSGTGLDRGTLARAADVNDAYEDLVKGAQSLMDTAQALYDGLQRDHGAVNEAHQAAPEGGAERGFYQPG